MNLLSRGLIFFGLCKGIYDSNIWASLYDVVPPSRRSTSVGMMNMIGWIGGAMLAFLVGSGGRPGHDDERGHRLDRRRSMLVAVVVPWLLVLRGA